MPLCEIKLNCTGDSIKTSSKSYPYREIAYVDFQCSQGGIPALPNKQLPAGKRVDLKSKEMLFVSKLLEALSGFSAACSTPWGITILMQMEERAHTLCGTTDA
ncbi:hypothetical protein CY34DRAFT_563851 [Suillus luteus UH-Slu-Lm8-n1]|uniref:Unplaced genomic scaffold CY34scaffold_47, whole genome shotgun sequence n=1 Tax=Suillus luteus UH-Slu-Lm8-n1 TaxID=930992 RepID=A0A0D0BG86_9AGAM|nr:hypothetical protein CY34DRAFT_563851 [Suillus luteus UH-Slu-Lm8-n1]